MYQIHTSYSVNAQNYNFSNQRDPHSWYSDTLRVWNCVELRGTAWHSDWNCMELRGTAWNSGPGPVELRRGTQRYSAVQVRKCSVTGQKNFDLCSIRSIVTNCIRTLHPLLTSKSLIPTFNTAHQVCTRCSWTYYDITLFTCQV